MAFSYSCNDLNIASLGVNSSLKSHRRNFNLFRSRKTSTENPQSFYLEEENHLTGLLYPYTLSYQVTKSHHSRFVGNCVSSSVNDTLCSILNEKNRKISFWSVLRVVKIQHNDHMFCTQRIRGWGAMEISFQTLHLLFEIFHNIKCKNCPHLTDLHWFWRVMWELCGTYAFVPKKNKV